MAEHRYERVVFREEQDGAVAIMLEPMARDEATQRRMLDRAERALMLQWLPSFARTAGKTHLRRVETCFVCRGRSREYQYPWMREPRTMTVPPLFTPPLFTPPKVESFV